MVFNTYFETWISGKLDSITSDVVEVMAISDKSKIAITSACQKILTRVFWFSKG